MQTPNNQPIKLYRLFPILLFISILLSSCFKYEEVEIKDIKSVKLLEFSDKGLTVESEIKISNPNNFDIKVVNSEFNVSVQGDKICKSRIDNKLDIPKNSEAYHTLIMRSDYKDLEPGVFPKLIALTSMSSDKINFKVDGFITGKAFMFTKKVEVSHEGKVPLKLF